MSSGVSHSLYFDYGGFPPESYEYKYPASGSPDLAQSIRDLLRQNDIPSAEDNSRGYDHGVFVPLMLMYPDANIPVVAMSILSNLDPTMHISIGRALAPLRDQGVLIVGSGYSFHNFDYFFAKTTEKKKEGVQHSHLFNNFLVHALTSDEVTSSEDKLSRLENWASAPSARIAHKHRQEEHLIPLHVIAGVGEESGGVCSLIGDIPSSNEIAVLNVEWR